jgi:hypothetical protein
MFRQCAALLIGTFLLSTFAGADPALPIIVGLKGDAQVLSKAAVAGLPSLLYEGEKFYYVKAKIGLKVEKNSIIICSSDCRMKLVYPSGSSIFVAPGATFRVLEAEEGPQGEKNILLLLYGRLRSLVSKTQTRSWEVRTRSAISGVRGTDFLTRSAPTEGTEVTVLGGKVDVKPVEKGKSEIMLASQQSVSQTAAGDFVTNQSSKAEVLSAYETTLVPPAPVAERPAVQPLEEKAKTVALEELRVSHPEVFKKIENPAALAPEELNRKLVEQPLEKAKSEGRGKAEPFTEDLDNYKKYMGEGK